MRSLKNKIKLSPIIYESNRQLMVKSDQLILNLAFQSNIFTFKSQRVNESF